MGGPRASVRVALQAWTGTEVVMVEGHFWWRMVRPIPAPQGMWEPSHCTTHTWWGAVVGESSLQEKVMEEVEVAGGGGGCGLR